MRARPGFPRFSAAVIFAIIGCCSALFAQGNSNAKKTSSTSDEYPDLVELDPFGGVSVWGAVVQGLDEKLANGGTAGGRVAVNFNKYLGLELGYNFMINNVRLLTPVTRGLPTYNFGDQIHYLALNPVVNFRPRGSRVQPYFTVGVGAIQFTPTKQARDYARLATVDAVYHSANLNDNLQVALNYGGGVKFHLSEHFGLRFDARGLWSRNATFNLPNYNDGGLYIPSRQHFNGFEGTMGLVIYLGQPARPAPPEAPPPPPAPLNAGTITGTDALLCQGKAITLHSTASDPAGHTLNYTWVVNGSSSGNGSSDLTFTPNNTGDFQIQVTITDAANPARTVTSGPITLSVREAGNPQISSISATPDTLSCASDTTGTHTSNLAAHAIASACGGNLTYKWTVSEGSVNNDTSSTASFDSTGLSFESGSQGQTKTVIATLKVTDGTGKSAAQTTNVLVKCPPQMVRLPDIIFARNNSRVNNCGKRILIDQAAPRVSGGDYNILLIGHIDNDEHASTASRARATRRRRAVVHPLDEQRVLNSAAVISGGTGTCAQVDPTRIKVDWVGTDQTSTPDPGLCGTSNLPSQSERRESKVTNADKNRRVEVYLVPSNSQVTLPAAKNIRSMPESEVRELGCPK